MMMTIDTSLNGLYMSLATARFWRQQRTQDQRFGRINIIGKASTNYPSINMDHLVGFTTARML